MGVHAGIAQRQQGDVTTVSFLLLDGCPGSGSDQMVFILEAEGKKIWWLVHRQAEKPRAQATVLYEFYGVGGSKILE